MSDVLGFSGVYRFLSNFYPATVEYDVMREVYRERTDENVG